MQWFWRYSRGWGVGGGGPWGETHYMRGSGFDLHDYREKHWCQLQCVHAGTHTHAYAHTINVTHHKHTTSLDIAYLLTHIHTHTHKDTHTHGKHTHTHKDTQTHGKTQMSTKAEML